MLYATVRNRKIHVKKPDTVVQNGVKVDWLKLEMDDEWAEMETIVCVFVNRHTEEVDGKLTEKEITKERMHTFGGQVLVPWECLVDTGMLSVSCTGYVGGEKIMTTMYPDSFWNVVQNGPTSGEETLEPTPSLYNQILAAAGEATAAAIAANQAKDQLLQDKANGVFNGEDGVSPKVSVGSTQTGSEGSNAEVYATGTEQDLKLNFVIPRGKQGLPGKEGPRGAAAAVVSETEPTDPEVVVWVDPNGDPETDAAVLVEQAKQEIYDSLFVEPVALTWEKGGLTTNTGAENSLSGRMRTGFLPNFRLRIKHDSKNCRIVARYYADATTESYIDTGSWLPSVFNLWDEAPEGTKYIRFMAQNYSGTSIKDLDELAAQYDIRTLPGLNE